MNPDHTPSARTVALLTACKDPHYALGLAPALAGEGLEVEMIGDDQLEGSGLFSDSTIRLVNLRDEADESSPILRKGIGLLRYYVKLISFAARSNAKVFHILWWRRFVHFERTVLNLYFRMLGKRLVFTAHNVNTEARDGKDSRWNRWTLRRHYLMMDHVFVHTALMKEELAGDFGVPPEKVTVVRYPINNVTPQTGLAPREAREKLGIGPDEKVLLFFGNIAAYKGLEDVIRALPLLAGRLEDFKLLLAGNVKKGQGEYFQFMQETISALGVSDAVLQRIEYIPEEEVEIYFKASDLCLLPYRRIFQSGVLFLSYSFGLPVIVSDAGGLPEEVAEGETGFVCRAADPGDLAEKIVTYFDSPLYRDLGRKRPEIQRYAEREYSWKNLAEATRRVYQSLAS